MRIWLATIGHRHGMNFYVGLTEAEVRARVLAYVRDNWETEEIPGPIPEDSEAAINQYFLGDHAHEESVGFEQVDLELRGSPLMEQFQTLRVSLQAVLAHAENELEQRQSSGNGEEYAELEADCEAARAALRATDELLVAEMAPSEHAVIPTGDGA